MKTPAHTRPAPITTLLRAAILWPLAAAAFTAALAVALAAAGVWAAGAWAWSKTRR